MIRAAVQAIYLPPEQWVALASVVLIAASAATLWLLREIDKGTTLPGGAR